MNEIRNKYQFVTNQDQTQNAIGISSRGKFNGVIYRLFDDPGHAAVRRGLKVAMCASPGPVLEKFPPQIGMA